MTQQQLLIKRLKKGWLDSLQAVQDCRCLKLTTRVNEPEFMAKIAALGLKLQRKVKNDRYVQYRLVK